MTATVSYFDVDSNCADCFNLLLDTLAGCPGVSGVRGDAARGCVVVDHDTDERVLLDVVTTVGRRWVVGDNSELVLDAVHATAGHTCPVPR